MLSSRQTGTHPLKTLWEFSRPHTLIGTSICIPSLYLYAAPSFSSLLSVKVLGSIGYAMTTAALTNVFITGLNQLSDVEIDKINKPYLPLASGQLSRKAAVRVVSSCLVGALALSILSRSPFLLGTVFCSLFLGILYSSPPFRLKRFPLLAALCIIVVRGLIVNIGFYGHALLQYHQLQPLRLLHDARCILPALYFAVFGSVIAMMKDIPDIKGDTVHNIRSFPVRIGARRVFQTGCYLIQVLMGTTMFSLWATLPHGLLSVQARVIVLWACLISMKELDDRYLITNPDSPQEVYGCYMFLWRLFYRSYLFLPLVR